LTSVAGKDGSTRTSPLEYPKPMIRKCVPTGAAE